MATNKAPKKSKLKAFGNLIESKEAKWRNQKQPNCEVESAKVEYIREKTLCGMSPHTLEDYNNMLELVFASTPPDILEKPLIAWTQVDLDLISEIILKRKSQKTGSELSASTKESYLRTFRQFIKWMHEKGKIGNIVVRPYRAPQAPPKMYTQEEVAILASPPSYISTLSFIEIRNYVIVRLLAETGMRKRSLVNIRICDVDLKNELIQIVKSKTKKVYCVTISPITCRYLADYISIRTNHDTDETDILFCNIDQQPLTPDGLTSVMKKYITSKGVTFRGIHAFRHYCITSMAKNGASTADIAMQSGHADLRQVQGYVHATVAMDKDKFKRYNPLG